MGLFYRKGLILLVGMFLVLLGGPLHASAGVDIAELRKAAEQGDADAQYQLGSMYGEGRGVPQDEVNAYVWFSLAAVQGEEIAARNRDIIAKKLTPEQRSKAKDLVAEFQAKIDNQMQMKLPRALRWPSSSPPAIADKAELRAWLQSIKPAAGGK